MNDPLLIGLNHTTAPLDVRERLALPPQRAFDAITAWQARSGGGEVVMLSTCNRVELYLGGGTANGTAGQAAGGAAAGVTGGASAGPVDRRAVVDFLAETHGVPAAAFADYLYELRGRPAVEHLFAVASGLDSMVLGESQILGQVRQAYEASRAAGATGPVLNPLFQRAATVGKEVLTGTGLGDGRVSVASVAVDYARRIFDTFADKTVLCLGTGKMSTLVLQGFVALKAGRVMVASRDQARADAFAAQFGQTSVGVTMDDLDRHLVASDVVIGSTGATHPVVTRDRVAGLMKKRRYRPLFFLDIAVPRDVEASVGEIDGVYLYDLDDLQAVVSRTFAGRHGQMEAAQAVVRRHVDAYAAWHRQREIGPLIDALYRRSGDVARAELDRTLGKLDLDAAGRQQVEALVHRVVQKLLHGPVSRLKAAHDAHGDAKGEGKGEGKGGDGRTGDGPAYVHAVEKLFGLGGETMPPDESADADADADFDGSGGTDAEKGTDAGTRRAGDDDV